MPAKIILASEQLEQIVNLSNQGLGCRKIAKILNLTRDTVRRAARRELRLDLSNKKSIKLLATEIKCMSCGITQLRDQFVQHKSGRKCLTCCSKISRKDKGKTRFTEEQLAQVLYLYNNSAGQRKIALIMGASRSTIRAAYKQLNLSNKNRTPRYAYKDTERVCNKCNTLYSIKQFRKEHSQYADGSLRISFSRTCRKCESKKRKQLREEHSDLSASLNVIHFIRNSLIQFVRSGNISNNEIWSTLEYTIDDLVNHLETQFEWWMTWKNYGAYRIKEWCDADIATHKWSIDHIIPKADLPYDSILHPNFKKCWALSNLRPYNAKQNQIDGGTLIRHAKNRVDISA